MTDATRQPPYKCRMHYDASVQGVWIGYGVDLSPACGQSEFIGVTGHREIVECMKCLDAMSKSG